MGISIGSGKVQPFYIHKQGWYVIRLLDDAMAPKLANAMKSTCREEAWADSYTLVYECIKNVTGEEISPRSLGYELDALIESGLFTVIGAYVSQEKTPVFNGDVLMTRTPGMAAIVVSGAPKRTK